MRFVVLAVALLIPLQFSRAAVAPEIDPRASLGVVQQWIYNYRAKPDYAHVPAAVRVLFHSQTFKEPENAGIYLGFIAGAIGSNPAKSEQLVNSFFPVPPEDEWVIVRAIAYSGLPDWRILLRKVAPKMPGRKVMIDGYLAGTLPTLMDIPLEEKKPGMLDKLRGAFTQNPFAKEEKKLNVAITYAGNQDLLDTLWGYYFATGSHVPIGRIIQMMPWSKSRDTVDKLSIGSMARYTLASYAVRDAELREFLRSELSRQPAPVKAPLIEVVEAADTVQLGAVRKDALAAVEELKAKGSDARRNLDFWGQVASVRLPSAASRRRLSDRSRSAFPASSAVRHRRACCRSGKSSSNQEGWQASRGAGGEIRIACRCARFATEAAATACELRTGDTTIAP